MEYQVIFKMGDCKSYVYWSYPLHDTSKVGHNLWVTGDCCVDTTQKEFTARYIQLGKTSLKKIFLHYMAGLICTFVISNVQL